MKRTPRKATPTPHAAMGAAAVRKPPPRPARSAHVPAAYLGGHGGWATLTVIVLAFAGSGLWYWLGGAPAADPAMRLQGQMQAAARTLVPSSHVFGGALRVARINGQTQVIAEAVPAHACTLVAWRLAREGAVLVNGVMAARLSAPRLAELCDGDGTTLLWMPNP